MGTLSLSTRAALDIRQVGERSVEALVTCDTIHMRLALRIELDPEGEGFDFSVVADGLRGDLPRFYRLLGVEFLPEFGAARTGEQGYLTLAAVVPSEGSGTRCARPAPLVFRRPGPELEGAGNRRSSGRPQPL